MSALARAEARKLLKKYCINSPAELDIEKLAAAEHLIIEDQDLNNFIGMINYGKGYGIIKIDKNLKTAGQRRFVIAHEMGHYYNDNKNGLGCSQLDLLSYNINTNAESIANTFAAELLMPAEWVKNFVGKNKPGIELLNKGAEYFGVSLSAIGIKIAETGDYPFAVIMSKEGKVIWRSINKSFPFQWIPVGYKVNNNSYAYDMFKIQNEKLKIQKDINTDKTGFLYNENTQPEEVLADAWFWEDKNYKKNYYMYEQNINMPFYNSVFTILWAK